MDAWNKLKDRPSLHVNPVTSEAEQEEEESNGDSLDDDLEEEVDGNGGLVFDSNY